MTHKKVKVFCGECQNCCKFFTFVGKELSASEIKYYFNFERKIADILMQKKQGKYLVGKNCQQYRNIGCGIYENEELPFVCAFYPYFITEGTSGSHNICADYNCKTFKQKGFNFNYKEMDEVIADYKDALNIFSYEDLVRSGYKLKIIRRNVKL